MFLINIKNKINNLFGKSLFKISIYFENLSSFIYTLSANIYPYMSLNELDKKIEKLIPEILNKSTFFIEVGANDGINQSNTFFLEKKYKCKGLLIEPSQTLFEKCKKYRSKKNIFENCALVSKKYKKDFVEIVYANLMSIVSNDSNRNIRDHLKISKKFYKKDNYFFYARAKTLTELLDKHKINHVDFLSIDVEGYELNLLEGINFPELNINFILIETNDFFNVNDFLALNRYKLLKKLSKHDYLYKLYDD